MNILVNLLRYFLLTIASTKAPIAYLIDVIMIEKSIIIGHTWDIEV